MIAISIWVCFQISLVLSLSRIIHGCVSYGGAHSVSSVERDLTRFEDWLDFVRHFLCYPPLWWAINKYYGWILGSNIMALLESCCWVVECVEMLYNVFIWCLFAVEFHVEDLDEASLAAAYFAVGGVCWRIRVWVHKSDWSRKYGAGIALFEILGEELLCAPVAAGTKGGQLFTAILVCPLSRVGVVLCRRPCRAEEAPSHELGVYRICFENWEVIVHKSETLRKGLHFWIKWVVFRIKIHYRENLFDWIF